jgi:hypothetical protein
MLLAMIFTSVRTLMISRGLPQQSKISTHLFKVSQISSSEVVEGTVVEDMAAEDMAAEDMVGMEAMEAGEVEGGEGTDWA